MSVQIKQLAEKYYPNLWNKERLDALLKAGQLTQKEYDEIIDSVKES